MVASYDTAVSLYANQSTPLCKSRNHSQAILSTCWISTNTPETNWIASGGMDRIIKVSSIPSVIPSSTLETVIESKVLYHLPLHSAPVSSLRNSFHQPNTLISAGWDGLVAVWNIDQTAIGESVSVEEENRKVKRRKVNEDKIPKLVSYLHFRLKTLPLKLVENSHHIWYLNHIKAPLPGPYLIGKRRIKPLVSDGIIL